jgi:AAA-like domain/Effector-associated domain 4
MGCGLTWGIPRTFLELGVGVMARPNYGPQAKKRAKRLLEVLLAYANHELEVDDPAQIQVIWQTDTQLVVRTKIRFLEELTAIDPNEVKLNAVQIKEALKRLEDFLAILEDNRSSTQGSENWHFTLKLWHKRYYWHANLERFDVEWERRRLEKSKLASVEETSVLQQSFCDAKKRQDWGKAVDYATFEELRPRLKLDWKEISALDVEVPCQTIEIDPETPDLNDATQDTSPRYPNGAVPLGSPFYLERVPFEEQIKQEIRKPGALVRIKAPREMGKTSLLLRILDSAQHLGYSSVSLNLEQVDQAILSDLDQFLRWLCANAGRQLQLKPKLDQHWDQDLGSKISCTSYFQDYLLQEINTPLVLALDEVNEIFEHPQVAKDFLPLLRSWYEEAKTLPVWQKLRLIVVHSTEIYVPLNLNQSPFNVGLPIQLNNFRKQEVQQLAQCYGLDWEAGEEARQLMDMVGGHPALVHIALYHLSRGEVTLAQLLETAPTASGIYNHHLLRHWATLKKRPELLIALNSVMNATKPLLLEPIISHKLSSMGLIKQLGHKAISDCELYRQFFLKD